MWPCCIIKTLYHLIRYHANSLPLKIWYLIPFQLNDSLWANPYQLVFRCPFPTAPWPGNDVQLTWSVQPAPWSLPKPPQPSSSHPRRFQTPGWQNGWTCGTGKHSWPNSVPVNGGAASGPIHLSGKTRSPDLCHPALSRMTGAWRPLGTMLPISFRCLFISTVLAQSQTWPMASNLNAGGVGAMSL